MTTAKAFQPLIWIGRLAASLAAGVAATAALFGALDLVGIIGQPVGHSLQTAIVGAAVGAFYGAAIWSWRATERWSALRKS